MAPRQNTFHIRPLEVGIFIFALFALASGVYRNDPLSLFWGVLISLGLVALFFVRRKDWNKHWEDLSKKEHL